MKSIKKTMRSKISHRTLPISVVDVNKLTEVLTDHEKRIRALERYLGLKKVNLEEKKKNNSHNTKKKKKK